MNHSARSFLLLVALIPFVFFSSCGEDTPSAETTRIRIKKVWPNRRIPDGLEINGIGPKSNGSNDAGLYSHDTTGGTACPFDISISVIGPDFPAITFNEYVPDDRFYFSAYNASTPSYIQSFGDGTSSDSGTYDPNSDDDIEVEVPVGDNRRIEISGVIHFDPTANGTSGACQFSSSSQSFLIHGQTENFAVTSETTDVYLPVTILTIAAGAEANGQPASWGGMANHGSHKLTGLLFSSIYGLGPPCYNTVSGSLERVIDLKDINTGQIIRTVTTSTISLLNSIYVGPVFPGHKYRATYFCDSNTTKYSVDVKVPDYSPGQSLYTVKGGSWVIQ